MNTDHADHVRPGKYDRIEARLREIYPEGIVRVNESLHCRVERLMLNVHDTVNTASAVPDTLPSQFLTNRPSHMSDKRHYFQALSPQIVWRELHTPRGRFAG